MQLFTPHNLPIVSGDQHVPELTWSAQTVVAVLLPVSYT